MKNFMRNVGSNNSGQLLLVAALAIGILISSTTVYVYELSKETNSPYTSSISNFFLALKQSTRNAIISSLANASNEGEKTVLTANLNSLSQVFRSLNHFGICDLASTPLNDSNYDSGVWLSWNTSNMGISSAYVDFNLKAYGLAANVTLCYAVNITTAVTIDGYYTDLGGNEKLVDLTCNVYNEGEPALARNMTLFYERLGSWIQIDPLNSLSIIDCGNGTYCISFTVQTSLNAVQVSARIYDLRGIFVQANSTCYEA